MPATSSPANPAKPNTTAPAVLERGRSSLLHLGGNSVTSLPTVQPSGTFYNQVVQLPPDAADRLRVRKRLAVGS